MNLVQVELTNLSRTRNANHQQIHAFELHHRTCLN